MWAAVLAVINKNGLPAQSLQGNSQYPGEFSDTANPNSLAVALLVDQRLRLSWFGQSIEAEGLIGAGGLADDVAKIQCRLEHAIALDTNVLDVYQVGRADSEVEGVLLEGVD